MASSSDPDAAELKALLAPVEKAERKLEMVRLLLLAILSFAVFSVFSTWPSFYTAIFGILCIFGAAHCAEWLSMRVERYPYKNRPVLITGCDTGLGHALATKLAQSGAIVFAGCLHSDRNGASDLKRLELPNLHVLQMDVRKEDEMAECCRYVESKLNGKGLWGLMNNAGLNFFGAVETTSMEQYERVVGINQLGMVRVTKTFLPLIRKAKGRIVNVTSIKGLVSEPMNAAYCMTKYATEAFSDCLRMEMKKFGVNVVIVEPGDYGGATHCMEMNRINGDVSDMWGAMSKDLRSTYGKEFVDEHATCIEKAIPTTAQDISPVVEAMTNSLYALRPKSRYIVPGGAGWYDTHLFRARLARWVPALFMDSIWMHDFRSWPLPTAVSEDPTLSRLH